MAVANLSNLQCGVPYLGDSYNAKLVCFGEGAMELCTHEKAVFFLPHGVVAGFLGRTPTRGLRAPSKSGTIKEWHHQRVAP